MSKRESSDSTTVINKIFTSLYGKPCWNVTLGHGGFLTIEFGNPHLEIREPKLISKVSSTKVRKNFARRLVTLRGDWHLWIYRCDWNVFSKGRMVGESASSRRIERALAELNGQALNRVSINFESGVTTFEFDLGGRLQTMPDNAETEQWLLYEPSGYILTVRGDGRYSYTASDNSRKLKI